MNTGNVAYSSLQTDFSRSIKLNEVRQTKHIWSFHLLFVLIYRKNPKISDTRKFAVITLKVEQDGLFIRVMHPKDAEGIANSVDPDQTAPLGAVWSGSALFAQTCLSENFGTLRYSTFLPREWEK